MEAIEKIDISESRMDLEQNIPGTVRPSKGLNHERCMHEIFTKKTPLYLETNAFGVGLKQAYYM